MVIFQHGKGVLVRVIFFYVVSIALLILLGGLSLAFSFGFFEIKGVLAILSAAIIIGILAYWMPQKTLNKEMFERRFNLPEHG